jgi:transposase
VPGDCSCCWSIFQLRGFIGAYFVLYYKALAEEKFRWPREEQTLLTITGEQMNWLLEGYDLSTMKAHKKLHYEALC